VLADSDVAVAANGIGGTWRTPIAIVCMVVVPSLLVAVPDIIRWWRHSTTAFRLRWHVTYRFKLLRTRLTKTTAGAGAPTLPPPCPTCEDP
jgi:hypothetical protein